RPILDAVQGGDRARQRRRVVPVDAHGGVPPGLTFLVVASEAADELLPVVRPGGGGTGGGAGRIDDAGGLRAPVEPLHPQGIVLAIGHAPVVGRDPWPPRTILDDDAVLATRRIDGDQRDAAAGLGLARHIDRALAPSPGGAD